MARRSFKGEGCGLRVFLVCPPQRIVIVTWIAFWIQYKRKQDMWLPPSHLHCSGRSCGLTFSDCAVVVSVTECKHSILVISWVHDSAVRTFSVLVRPFGLMMGSSCIGRQLSCLLVAAFILLLVYSAPIYHLIKVNFLKRRSLVPVQYTGVMGRTISRNETRNKNDQVSMHNLKTVQFDLTKPDTREHETSSIRSNIGKKGHPHKLLVWHMIPSRHKHYNAHHVKCKHYTCIFSSNTSYIPEADAVIVDVFLLSRHRSKEVPLRSSPDQVWILFAQEPWANYRSLFPAQNWNGIFNWTLTYQRHSDFWVPYGVLRYQRSQKQPDWNKLMKLKTKKVLWLVGNCKALSKREEYVEELKKYIPVDIVGRCGRSNVNCTSGNITDEDKCLEQYKFYLSFESTLCKDYVTEKFFKTFQRDRHIIPIVRGNGDYAKHYPKDTYLNTADFRSPKDLAAHLLYLDKNSTAYLDLLKTHALYRHHSAGRKICDMCISLHTLDQHRKSYPDISGWMDRCDNVTDLHW
ncbi:3-galactosyl-N-acetylglucosaminide 4-alpha-L-fucosyltransferase FUT3-like [Haliotis cracherodii]|uniref:3-galactosyl-N-acetylglucosaminide 4-alpha-L-fucosyltransferase FUT3-like n=1 Tax=Haliotis cracherodii TaxID=6455 RepID=UPI0039E7F3AA